MSSANGTDLSYLHISFSDGNRHLLPGNSLKRKGFDAWLVPSPIILKDISIHQVS